MATRDPQASRVYKAEEAFQVCYAHTPPEFTLSECRLYLESVCRKPWFQKRWPGLRCPKVIVSEDSRCCAYYTNFPHLHHAIAFAPYGRNVRTMLHELAHACNQADEAGVTPEGLVPRTHYAWADHGPEFCRVYLFLVQRCIGLGAARSLRAALLGHRCHIAP